MKPTQHHIERVLKVIVEDIMLEGLGLLDNRPAKNPLQVWRSAKQSLERILRPVDQWHIKEPSDKSFTTIRLRHRAFFEARTDLAYIAYDFNNKWMVSIIICDEQEQVMAGAYFGKSRTDNLLVYMQKALVNDNPGLYITLHRFDDPLDAQPFDQGFVYFSDATGSYLELIFPTTGYRNIGKNFGKTDTSRS